MIDRLNLYFLLLVSVNIAFLSGWICECILWINSFLCSVATASYIVYLLHFYSDKNYVLCYIHDWYYMNYTLMKEKQSQ